MTNKFLKDNKDNFYLIFRLLVGILFMFHGLQKFGVIGGKPAVALMSLMGLAAIIETFGGLAITVGLYTVPAAVIAGLEMLYVFLFVHTPTSIVFTNNGGELSLLFLAAFLVIATHGAGKKWVLKK